MRNISDKYTVIHIIPFFESYQGYEEDLLSRYQAKDGNKVILITSFLNPGKEGRSFLKRFNFQLCKLDKGRFIFRLPCVLIPSKLSFLIGASIFLIFFKYDFLHLHGLLNPLGPIYALIARLRGKKVISDNHDFIYSTHQLAKSDNLYLCLRKIEFIFFRKFIGSVQLFLSNKVIAYENKCTEFLRDFYKYKGKIFQAKIGYEDDLFFPEEKYEIKNKIVNLGFAGQISQRKKPNVLLEILYLLPSNYKLKMIGSWDKKVLSSFLRKAEELNLKERLSIIGEINYLNLNKYFKQIDLAIYLNSSSISCQQFLGSGVPILVDKNQQFASSANFYGEAMAYKSDIEKIKKTVYWIKNNLKNFPKLTKGDLKHKKIIHELSYLSSYKKIISYAYLLNR